MGYEAGGAPGKIDDEDSEEFPGECSMGLVELDEGGDDESLDDVDESSAVDIPPPLLPELEIDVAWVVTLVFVKFDGVVYPESGWSVANLDIVATAMAPLLFVLQALVCADTDNPVDDISDTLEGVGYCWWVLWALICSEQRLPTSANAAAALLQNNSK